MPSSVASPAIVSVGKNTGDELDEPLTSNAPVPSVSEVAAESERLVAVMFPLSVAAPIRVSVVRVAVEEVESARLAFST